MPSALLTGMVTQSLDEYARRDEAAAEGHAHDSGRDVDHRPVPGARKERPPLMDMASTVREPVDGTRFSSQTPGAVHRSSDEAERMEAAEREMMARNREIFAREAEEAPASAPDEVADELREVAERAQTLVERAEGLVERAEATALHLLGRSRVAMWSLDRGSRVAHRVADTLDRAKARLEAA